MKIQYSCRWCAVMVIPFWDFLVVYLFIRLSLRTCTWANVSTSINNIFCLATLIAQKAYSTQKIYIITWTWCSLNDCNNQCQCHILMLTLRRDDRMMKMNRDLNVKWCQLTQSISVGFISPAVCDNHWPYLQGSNLGEMAAQRENCSLRLSSPHHPLYPPDKSNNFQSTQGQEHRC